MRLEESGNSFYLVILPPFAPNSQLCFWEERETEIRRRGWSDKIGTEWGTDITQREMKERESETESCWSLSKKATFLSPSALLSLCFSGCFDIFRQTHSASMWNRRVDTTDEECQLVVRGSHMLLISLSLIQLHSYSLSISLSAQSFVLLSPPPPPVLAVEVNLSTPKHGITCPLEPCGRSEPPWFLVCI